VKTLLTVIPANPGSESGAGAGIQMLSRRIPTRNLGQAPRTSKELDPSFRWGDNFLQGH